MKKMSIVKKLLIVLALIVAAFLIVVALQPSTFKVERSAKILAAPPDVFAQINDFRKWDAWSPWAKLDPAMKTTFDGPAEGTGAIYAWTGNKEVGEGRMTLTESRPSELIRIKLEFIKPFASTAATEFTFKPETGDQTLVTWTMAGENNFISKAFCLFMNMDKMIGGDFEKGLASLKSVTEMAAKQ
jgi:hypothetical protein